MASGSQVFVLGVFFAAMSAVFSYANIYSAARSLGSKQYSYAPSNFVSETPRSKFWSVLDEICGWIAFVLCVLSVVCFLVGTYFVRKAVFS